MGFEVCTASWVWMGLSRGLCLAQQNDQQQKEVHPTLGRCSQVKLANRRQVGPTFKPRGGE